MLYSCNKLTEQILKTDEVKKHKERLKETQVLDKLKEKDIENEKLRLELGSDYESSSDSSIFEDLDFKISEKSNEDDPDIYESGFIDISKKNEWLMGISSENEPVIFYYYTHF